MCIVPQVAVNLGVSSLLALVGGCIEILLSLMNGRRVDTGTLNNLEIPALARQCQTSWCDLCHETAATVLNSSLCSTRLQCGVASLAEGVAVLLLLLMPMQGIVICSMVLVIARLLFVKHTVESLPSTN